MREPVLNLDQWGEPTLLRRTPSAKESVVLDSETTGLKDPVGFVEIAVSDPGGNALVHTTVRPRLPIEPGAAKVHGYTAESLPPPSQRSTRRYSTP